MTLSGLDLIKQAISIYDSELRLTVCNSQFRTMFDLPSDYAKPGASFQDTIRHLALRGDYGPVDDIEEFVEEKVALALAFQPHYVERDRADGTTISVEGSPLRQGGWVTVYTDITEIKQQERALRARSQNLSQELLDRSEALATTNRSLGALVTALEAAKEELTTSQEQLALTHAMTPAHIARVDRSGVYTYTNGKLPTVLPGRGTDLVGQHFSDVLGAEVWKIITGNFQKTLSGEETVMEFEDPGTGRFVRLAMTPDRSDDGEVLGAYLLSTDATEEVIARTALGHARRRELAAQITSGMSHDFANLLTVVLGQQARLDSLAHLSPEVAKISATIKTAALRGGQLIEALNRLDPQRPLAPVPVALGRFVQDLSRLASAAVGAGIDLQVQSSLSDTHLIFDPGYAQDALLNLVLNAAEASSGRGAITITLGRSGPKTLEMRVTDTGPGFTPEALEKGLMPFFSTKGGKPGRGLGLPTAFDFAKSSGGKLRFANAPGGGAEVSMTIPYIVARALAPGMVLLVEDNLALRETIRSYLRDMDQSVIEAASVAEARQLVGIPDLTRVVTDLVLAGPETGTTLAREIAPRLPVLIMTGLPEADPRRQDAARDFTVLQKPFDIDALSRALTAA